MTHNAHDLIQHRLQLQQAADEWQKKIAYGYGAWRGDRALMLYVHQLTDEIEIWYELPNEKPVLVMKRPAEGFKIEMACEALRRADHRDHSAEEIEARVDADNAAAFAEQERDQQAQTDELIDRTWHAMRKDQGHHIKPIVVTSKP